MHAQAAAEALPMTGLPDARAAAGQLIRQATGGDLEAFEELVRRLQRRVYGFAYQHLRDLLREVMGLVEVSKMLVGEAVNPALQAADQLLESFEIAAGGLPDELAGGGPGVRQPGHGKRFGRCLRMHLR